MKLSLKIALTIFLCIFIGLSIFGYLAYRIVNNVVLSTNSEAQLVGATESMEQIDRLIYDHLNDIGIIAHESMFQDYFQKKQSTPAIDKYLVNLKNVTGPWDELNIINPDYTVISSSEPDNRNRDINPEAPEFQTIEEAFKGEESYSEAIIDPANRQTTIAVAAPIKNTDNQTIGVILGHIPWTDVKEIIATVNDFSALVDKNGIVLAQSPKTPDVLFKNVSNIPAVKKAIHGQSTTFEQDKNNSVFGKASIVTAVPQKGYESYRGEHWALIIERPVDAAFNVVNKTLVQLGLVLFSVVTISMISLFLALYKFITRPILHITKVVHSIALGNLSKRVTLKPSDEIGMMATEFNIMAEKLERSHQVLSKSYEVLKEKAIQSQEEETRFASSIESLQLGFIMSNAQGDIISANTAAQKILNSTQDGQTMFTLRLNDTYKLKDAIIECITSKKTLAFKALIYDDKFIDVTLTPIIMEKNNFAAIGAVIIIQDITESKIIERSKDEFFSIASHELRTPLTAIRSNTSIIKDYYKDKISDPDIMQIFDDIHEATVRLITIVNDFLNTSRLEQGRMQFKKDKIDVKTIAEGCAKELESIVQDKKITLSIEAQSDKNIAIGDSDKTKEIMLNLIGNAIKFTDKGGIIVKITSEEKQIKISVTDTGRGIPLANQGLLFRKFQQASDNILTRDSTQSSGLGLYISKLMTEGMGGTMYLEKSVESKGSTFVFTLPKEGI